MSRSRSNAVPPHAGHVRPGGRNSSIGRSYQASALYCSNTDGRLVDDRRGEDGFAAVDAVERRDRHAPGALARDAPVGPVGDHVEDAVVTPRRDPLDLVVDRVTRRIAQCPRLAVGAGDDGFAVHADEPLRGGEKDHRVVAAPAVRILVLERFAVPQAAALDAAPARLSGWRRTPAARRTARRSRGSVRPGRSARRSRGRTSCRSGSRRHHVRARCARRRCPAPASRSRRARQSSRARTADGGNGCLRAARRPSVASGGPNGLPTAADTRAASPSATITARPSTS